jgi:hypothetical protein
VSKVHTESGSIYEIEPNIGGNGYRVRRLVNGAPAADNVRATEEWREALEVTPPIVGQPMIIAWAQVGGITQSTLTSYVVYVTTDTN